MKTGQPTSIIAGLVWLALGLFLIIVPNSIISLGGKIAGCGICFWVGAFGVYQSQTVLLVRASKEAQVQIGMFLTALFFTGLLIGRIYFSENLNSGGILGHAIASILTGVGTIIFLVRFLKALREVQRIPLN